MFNTHNVFNGGWLASSVEVERAPGGNGFYTTSGLTYHILRAGFADTLSFMMHASKAGNVSLNIDYAMSVANAGNVEFTVAYFRSACNANPNTAVTSQAAFVFTPGNDTNKHECGPAQSATMTVAVAACDTFKMRITRSNGGNDTHPGNLYVIHQWVS